MLALHAVDMLRQHVRPETRIGSYIVNGGAASNVVPDYAEVECCIRHSEREYLDTVVAKVMNCFKGAAIATETTYDVTQMGCKFDNMVWNEAATKASEQVLQAWGSLTKNQRIAAAPTSQRQPSVPGRPRPPGLGRRPHAGTLDGHRQCRQGQDHRTDHRQRRRNHGTPGPALRPGHGPAPTDER